MPPQITLTATLHDQTGKPIPNAQLVVTLCGYGLHLPRIIGTSMLAKVGPVEYNLTNGDTSAWTTIDGTSGTSGIPLWGNDAIDPPGTFYAISIVDQKKNVVQCGVYDLTGSGTIDLSNAAQVIPTPGSTGNPNLAFATNDIWGISTSVAGEAQVTSDQFNATMGYGLPPGLPALANYGRTLTARPGNTYHLTRQAQGNGLLGLAYNGNILLPVFHYQIAIRTITLTFNTQAGDNLNALYVATSLN